MTRRREHHDDELGARVASGTDVNIRFNPEANHIAGTGVRPDVILAQTAWNRHNASGTATR